MGLIKIFFVPKKGGGAASPPWLRPWQVVLQKRMRRLVKLGIGGIKGGVMGVEAGIGGNISGRKSTRRLKKILMEGEIGIQVG